jgi:hypothetical protein
LEGVEEVVVVEVDVEFLGVKGFYFLILLVADANGEHASTAVVI